MIGPLLLAVLLVQSSASQEWLADDASNLDHLESNNEDPKSNVEIIKDLNAIPKINAKPTSDEDFNKEDLNDKLNFDFNFDGSLDRRDDLSSRRFRRNAEPSSPSEIKKLESFQSITVSNPKDQIELADVNRETPNDKQRISKMLLHEGNDVLENSREPRGATKEQWIRQPYPVRVTNENNYDNVPASSDEVRAPRVHFVTQKRAEATPPVYKNLEREGRGRDFTREEPKEVARTVPKKLPRTQERERERPVKQHYDPFRSFNPYRDEPYYRLEESRYNPQISADTNYDLYRPDFSSHRQRRIIYYATLPEVVRTPPNVNLRDRYNYRDRYDEGYVDYPSLLPEINHKPYYNARYESDSDSPKPYPLKVWTDLRVREAKKNPERRIYSEGERRYAHKLPYEAEQEYDHTI